MLCVNNRKSHEKKNLCKPGTLCLARKPQPPLNPHAELSKNRLDLVWFQQLIVKSVRNAGLWKNSQKSPKTYRKIHKCYTYGFLLAGSWSFSLLGPSSASFFAVCHFRFGAGLDSLDVPRCAACFRSKLNGAGRRNTSDGCFKDNTDCTRCLWGQICLETSVPGAGSFCLTRFPWR